MTESQVGFLYNLASALPTSQNNITNTVLKSYYLMRCKDITRGYGLPDKYFSSKIRCSKCCIEWRNNTEIRLKPIKLTKRQKHRLRSKRVTQNKKEYIRRRKDLPMSNELEQICTFCQKSTITPILKPQKQLQEHSADEVMAVEKTVIKEKNNVKSTKPPKKVEVNVYANALDVFSLKNKSNTLASTIKDKPKIINNNKKKKDKFAGLCQKAVLASAKLKDKNKKQNNLNLFLKPSST